MKNSTHQQLFKLLQQDNLILEQRIKETQQSIINVNIDIDKQATTGKIDAKIINTKVKLETQLEELKIQITKLRSYFELVKKDYKLKIEKQKSQQKIKDNTLPF